MCVKMNEHVCEDECEALTYPEVQNHTRYLVLVERHLFHSAHVSKERERRAGSMQCVCVLRLWILWT